MGQASPNEVTHHKKKVVVFMDTQKTFTRGLPMNLSFTYTDCFYSKFYYGRPAASADGMIDEDKGSLLSNGTTFGSVRGGTTLALDPVSTPSTGWMTSS